MKKYNVRMQYIFEGTYEITAENKNEARTLVTEQCGLVLGGSLHTVLDEDRVNWEFPLHPQKRILSVKLRNRKISE